MKAIVSADGLMAQAVNPYTIGNPPICFDSVEEKKLLYRQQLDFDNFEAANPPHPLTTPQEPGATIEVKEVWQIEHTRGWGTLRSDETELYVNSNATTRIAFEPILTQMSNEKNKAEGVDEAAGQNYYDKRINIASGSDSETYRLGAAFGAHWQRNDPAFIAEIVEKTLALTTHDNTIDDIVNQILKGKKYERN